MNEKKLYSLDYLKEISGGDERFIDEMLHDFVNDVPEVMKDLNRYEREGAWDELYSLVHKFAPTLAFVGLHSRDSEIDRIEYLAKNNEQVETIRPLLDKVFSDVNKTIDQIKKDFEL